MEQVKKVVLTEEATATGGRNGHVKSKSGLIDMDTMMPNEPNWQPGKYTNPEELFASCYATCFDGAVHAVAASQGHNIQSATTVAVDFGKTSSGFGIGASITCDITGVDKKIAQEIMEAAHQMCPYSKATRGNIEVNLALKS